MNKPTEDKEKFATLFERINVGLMNRRKETSKTYFKKVSRQMVLLIFFVSFLIVMSFFDIRKVNRNDYSIYFLMFGMITSLTIVICSNRNNNIFKLIHISFSFMLIGYILHFLGRTYDVTSLSYCGLVLAGVGYGVIISFAIIIFIYMLNMSERLMFVVAIIFIAFNYSFFQLLVLPDYVSYLIVPLGIIIIAYLVMLWMYRDKKLVLEDFSSELLPKSSIIIMLFVVCYICINTGVMGAIELNWSGVKYNSIKTFFSTSYYIGFIIAVVSTIINYMFNRKAIVTSLLIYTLATILSYQLGVVSQLFVRTTILRQLAECSFGLTTAMGIVSAGMLIGNLLEQRLSRQGFVYIMMTMVSFIIGGIFLTEGLYKVRVSIISTIMLFVNFTIAIFICVMALGGIFNRKEEKDTPVANMKKNQNKYKYINPDEVLSDKEKSIFNLLLEGFTLRQIAAELGMKYDAVNFHYKNIYRKLEVNSKVELFIRYGKN